MRRTASRGVVAVVLLALATLGTQIVFAGRPPLRKIRWARVATQAGLPPDLLRPGGRTLWNMRDLQAAGTEIVTLDVDGQVVRLQAPDGERIYTDRRGGDGAVRWLYPDRDRRSLRPGWRQEFDLALVRHDTSGAILRREHLWIELQTIGIGWLHLPSGPRETVLQRAVLRSQDDEGVVSGSLLHRWVDPRAGIVAEAEGPLPAAAQPWVPAQVRIATDVLLLTPLRVYVDQIGQVPGQRIAYGYDRGAGTTVGSLTPAPHTTMGDLLADAAWDFSGNTASDVFASYATTVAPAETCNFGACGYVAGRALAREDKTFLDPNGVARQFKIHTVTEIELRENPPGTPTDTTIWLRAGTINEGESASSLFARDGESRICYETGGGETRSPVPLWRFPNLDADGMAPDGWFMQAGDPRWSSAVFACEQNIFNQNCGVNPPFPSPARLWVRDCTDNSIPRSGTQFSEIVREGTVTLPSGHTFNALVIRTVADFCVYQTSACGGFFSKVDEVRTVNYIWQVPHLGTVVRLQSPQKSEEGCPAASDPDLCFTQLDETDIKFGLFPPRSITVTGVRDTEIDLSWDPGLITDRIDGYKVYWDTDSGGATPYIANSADQPGQASIIGTTATISGLAPGAFHFFTVTAISSFTNPSTSVSTSYESLLFPTQVSGDPSFVYPVEVMAETTCGLTAAVINVALDTSAADTVLAWDASGDPCLEGYRVLHATSPAAEANYLPFADTGPAPGFQGPAPDGFFLVVTRRGGSTGPSGHFQ